jgi:predicted nuclease with RNAse H fold
MDVFGFDLSGPVNTEDTAMVLVRGGEGSAGEWEVVRVQQGMTDAEVWAAVEAIDGRVVVGLDAPLSYEPGGGLRASDRALRERLAQRGYDRNYVMAPTMTRMIYLAARGMTLARGFKDVADVEVMEVHPVAALLLRGVSEEVASGLVESDGARAEAVAAMEEMGLAEVPGEVTGTDHLVCACAAAIGARDAAMGEPAWRAAASRPHHPFEFVC